MFDFLTPFFSAVAQCFLCLPDDVTVILTGCFTFLVVFSLAIFFARRIGL